MTTARLTVAVKPSERRFRLALPHVGEVDCLVSSRVPACPVAPSPKEEKMLAKRHAIQLCEALLVALEKY